MSGQEWGRMNRPRIDFGNKYIQEMSVAFVCALGLFLIGFPFSYCHKGHHYWGPGSARKVLMAMRLFVLIQLGLNIHLLYYAVKYDSPIIIRQFAQYPNTSTSWTYGIGRPIAGMVLFTSFGLIADCHQVFRWIVLIISLVQIFFDAISALQVGKYMDDVIALSGTSKAIPTRSYTIDMLKEYHWRDLISFGNGFLIFILSLHMMIIVGFFDNIIHYRKIQNNHHNRVKSMREALAIKLQKPMIKGEIMKKKPGADGNDDRGKLKTRKTKEK